MPDPDTVADETEHGGTDDRQPRADYGMATATFVVVSSMVGAGALTTSGYVLLSVHSHQLLLVLWAVGGLVALCGALTLAELSAALPKSGGEYVILFEAYGHRTAFLSGWVSLVLGFAAPIAAVASASATYLLTPFDVAGSAATRGLATLSILGFMLIHSSGSARTARVQGTITVAKITFLTVLIAAGVVAGRGHVSNLAGRPDLSGGLAGKMLFSLVYIYYAYTGWNAASYLGGEVADPGRRLPRAILLGTGVVVALYLGLNVFYALAIPVAEVRELAARKGTDAVVPIAQIAASRLFGPAWGGPLSFAVGVMLLGSLSAFVLTGPRVAFAMARSGQLPRAIGRLSGRGRTPVIATAALSAVALVMLWTGSFEGILLFSEVGLALLSLATVSAAYVLRWTRPELPRPFLVPGYPFVPAVYLVTTVALIGAVVATKPAVSALAVLAIAVGLPVHELQKRSRALPAPGADRVTPNANESIESDRVGEH